MFSVTINYLIYPVSLQALELLPANTKVRDVLTFLENVLEGKATEKRENQVLRSLLYAEHLQVGNYTFYGSSECVYFLFYIICFPSVTQAWNKTHILLVLPLLQIIGSSHMKVEKVIFAILEFSYFILKSAVSFPTLTIFNMHLQISSCSEYWLQRSHVLNRKMPWAFEVSPGFYASCPYQISTVSFRE